MQERYRITPVPGHRVPGNEAEARTMARNDARRQTPGRASARGAGADPLLPAARWLSERHQPRREHLPGGPEHATGRARAGGGERADDSPAAGAPGGGQTDTGPPIAGAERT